MPLQRCRGGRSVDGDADVGRRRRRMRRNGSCGLPCERQGGKGKGEGEIYHLCFGPPSTEKVRITLLPVSSASPSSFSSTTSRDGIPPCSPLPPSRPFPPLVSTPPQPPTNAISTRIFPSLSSATCPRVKRCQHTLSATPLPFFPPHTSLPLPIR